MIHLEGDDRQLSALLPFSLWAIDAHRSLEHRGHRLRLAVDHHTGVFRVDLPTCPQRSDTIIGSRSRFRSANTSRSPCKLRRANATLVGRQSTLGYTWQPASQHLILTMANS